MPTLPLSFLLILSLVYCARLKSALRVDVAGTYSAGSFYHPHYLVFQRDGVFHKYRQFTSPTTGTYSVEENVITLREDGQTSYLVFGDRQLYGLVQDGSSPLIYSRLSGEMIFINARDLEWPAASPAD